MDGTYHFKEAGLEIVILDHDRGCFKYSLQIEFQVTNNVAEYEEAIFRVMTSKKLRVNHAILDSNSC